MLVLPQIPPRIIRIIENEIRNFVWSGRKSKISYSILCNTKDCGGVQLVNLKNKDKALKATWPQILDQEKEYATMVYGIMRCGVIKTRHMEMQFV